MTSSSVVRIYEIMWKKIKINRIGEKTTTKKKKRNENKMQEKWVKILESVTIKYVMSTANK